MSQIHEHEAVRRSAAATLTEAPATPDASGDRSSLTGSTAPASPDARPDGPFRPDIQGLRALAVGLVVLFHLWPNRLSGGYVGVDVFFVVSGYLITSHLFREVSATGTVRVFRFWARRIRRLLPASLLVLLVSGAAVLLLAPSTTWASTARQIGASALYVENWALTLDAVDYMAQDNLATVAQHYWSLSVEEQFYFVWPLIVLALLGVTGAARKGTAVARRVIVGGMLAVSVASLGWSVLATADNQATAYLSTFTRAWEFGLGALAGLVVFRLPRAVASALAWTGVVAIVVSSALYTETSAFPGWIALAPVLGTVAVLLAPSGGLATVGWWLSRPVATRIGDISYSVYLVHWPLIVIVPFVTGHSLRTVDKVAILVATLVLAAASKRYVEDPFRRAPFFAHAPWRALAFAAVGAAVIVGAGFAVHRDLQHRESVAMAQAARIAAGQAQGCEGPNALKPELRCASVTGEEPLVDPAVVTNEMYNPMFSRCQVSYEPVQPRSCEVGAAGAPHKLALIGDSHATSWLPALDRLGREHSVGVVVHIKASCPASKAERVLPNETSRARAESCNEFNRQALAALVRDQSVTDVVVATYSSAYDWSYQGATGQAAAVQGFHDYWSTLVAAGKRVHVVRDVPLTGKRNVPACIAAARGDAMRCAVPRDEALPADVAFLAATERADPGVRQIDLTPSFCDSTWCYGQVGSVIVYRDKSHLSIEFATLLADQFARPLGLPAAR